MAIYVGKSGHVITLATGQDITACTKLAMIVTRPDGTSVEWAATPSSTAGNIEYIIQGSDIPAAGQYFIQAYLEWGDGDSEHTGEPYILDVLPMPPAWSNVEAVKLELGKGPSVDLLSDAEISYFLVRASDNVLMAASFAAESLAGYYADRVDKSMGGSSVSMSQKAEAWRKKAAALKALALSPTLYARASASAAVARNFAVGQHDYPGSTGVVGDEQW